MRKARFPEKPSMNKLLPAGVKVIVGCLIVVGAVAATVFVAREKPQLLGISTNNANPTQPDKKAILSEVGTIFALPTDEEPTIATVTDPEKLKDQQFFQKALTADIVLIYNTSRKAILYRPSEKKIIEVGAVNIDQVQQVTPSPSVIPSVSPAR